MKRKPERVVESFIKGWGKEGKLRSKMAANKQRNWLLAVMLNGFARNAAKLPLTDVEQAFVRAFREHGFSNDQIASFGSAYRKLPPAVREEIFPGKFAKLSQRVGYSLADVKEDAPTLVKATFAMPIARDIDVEAVHAGKVRLKDVLHPPREVHRAHGSNITRIFVPARNPPNPKYTIKAVRFKCKVESGIGIGSDEPYWLFATAHSNGARWSDSSKVWGDVDSGDIRVFPTNQGRIWGQDGLKQDIPAGEVASVVQLVEHDEGDVSDIQNGWNAAVVGVSGILLATGVAAWVAAVWAAVGGIVSWIIGMLDDDPIADATFSWTRQVIDDQVDKKPGSFDMHHTFTDSDAEYELRIRVTRY
jgi:hypothetical protein